MTDDSIELLLEILHLAKQHTIEQYNDLYRDVTFQVMAKRNVFGLLDLTGVGFHQEGEYDFWSEADKELFFKVDGNPSASYALFLTLLDRHEIREKQPVYMQFRGVVDESLGSTVGNVPIPLHKILKPIKFFETNEVDEWLAKPPNANWCIPYWEFAKQVIYEAPHMFKEGYTLDLKTSIKERPSWARLLVLMFVPREELLSMIHETALLAGTYDGWVGKDGKDWYDEAMQQLKDVLMGSFKAGHWTAVKRDFDDLCEELHSIRRQYLEDRSKVIETQCGSHPVKYELSRLVQGAYSGL